MMSNMQGNKPITDIRATIEEMLVVEFGFNPEDLVFKKMSRMLEALLNTQLAAERAAILAALPKSKKGSDKSFKTVQVPVVGDDGDVIGHYPQKESTARPYNDGFNDCRDTITNLIKERDTL